MKFFVSERAYFFLNSRGGCRIKVLRVAGYDGDEFEVDRIERFPVRRVFSSQGVGESRRREPSPGPMALPVRDGRTGRTRPQETAEALDPRPGWAGAASPPAYSSRGGLRLRSGSECASIRLPPPRLTIDVPTPEATPPMSRKSKRRGRAKQRAPEARRADRYALYEKSVQDPDADIHLIRRVFRKRYGRPPRLLREDFCGTALLACRWVQQYAENRAWGIDLDPKPLAWGHDHNVAPLRPDQASRVKLIEGDVRDIGHEKVDVTVGFNFSYFLFKTRGELREYFEKARASLRDEGMLVLDAYGGPDSNRTSEEERSVEASPTSGTSTTSTPSTTPPRTTSTSSSRTAATSGAPSPTTGACGSCRRFATCCSRRASPRSRSTGRGRTATRARATTSSRVASEPSTTPPGSPTSSPSPSVNGRRARASRRARSGRACAPSRWS